MTKKTIAILLAASMCLLMACSANSAPATTSTQASNTQSQAEVTPESVPESTSQTPEPQAELTLYIGTDDTFEEYVVSPAVAGFDDSEKAAQSLETLVAEMGTLTGWNLDCDITVYKSVGVAFANDGTIFTGPPMEQKEEFHMFDAYQLTQTILDSVAKTIQMNLGGDPAAIEVYFSTETDTELTFDNIEMYVPMDEAYAGLVPMG